MPHRTNSPVVLEPEYLEGFRQIYEEKIVFNKTLGLKLVKVTPEGVEARIDMRPELVGHYAYNRMACLAAKHMKETPTGRLERFAKLGTIDLRVDYLRPGIGEHFTIHAHALRVGTRVGTSRLGFRGPECGRASGREIV